MSNNSIIRLLMTVSILGLSIHFTQSNANAGSFNFTSMDTPISTNTVTTISTISATGADGQAITDVNVTLDTFTDASFTSGTFTLILEEISSGTSVTLASESLIFDEMEFDAVTFDDAAAQEYTVNAPSPFESGTFRPSPGALATFNGLTFNDGDWQLVSTLDGEALILTENRINSWSLNVETAIVPEPGTYMMFATMLTGAGFMVVRMRRKNNPEAIVEA